MYQQERMDEIVKILKENHYVTVNYLVDRIKYSPASIRRDLTLLEKQGIVTRSYGGVSYKDTAATPFKFRQHFMKTAKNAIAKKAASLVKDGNIVFLDGSSTTQYMGKYLVEKKGITVITSNMLLAGFLGDHGIKTFCTGGSVEEAPNILGGPIMLDTLMKFKVDIAFFSSSAINQQGEILTMGEGAAQYYQTYRRCAKRLAYLCGSEKLEIEAKYVSLTLSDVDYLITDAHLPDSLKEKYKSTVYLYTSRT